MRCMRRRVEAAHGLLHEMIDERWSHLMPTVGSFCTTGFCIAFHCVGSHTNVDALGAPTRILNSDFPKDSGICQHAQFLTIIVFDHSTSNSSSEVEKKAHVLPISLIAMRSPSHLRSCHPSLNIPAPVPVPMEVYRHLNLQLHGSSRVIITWRLLHLHIFAQ